MERNMLDYLPDALRPYRELRAMAAGWQALFDGLWRAADQALDDQFVTTASEYGLSRWESMLGIRAKGTESLDKRRARVLSRLLEQLPFTMRGLLVQLETLCGGDGFTVELREENNVLYVRCPLALKQYREDARGLLERIVPAALRIDFDLERNTHSKLAAFTHRELAQYTHHNLEEEVMIHAGTDSELPAAPSA